MIDCDVCMSEEEAKERHCPACFAHCDDEALKCPECGEEL